MRKLSDGVRSIYHYGHFSIRLFHRLMTYPIHSCFVSFLIYLQIMDIILYFQIRSRRSLQSMIVTPNQTDTELFDEKTRHIFDSLPVKKIMIGQTVSNKRRRMIIQHHHENRI